MGSTFAIIGFAIWPDLPKTHRTIKNCPKVSAVAEELAAKMAKIRGLAANVFACNSRLTNEDNNRSIKQL